MEQDHDRTKSFTRRAFFVGALQGCVLGILGGRLAWLQVSQGQHYKMLSDHNRINIKMLAPTRGRILDRFGVPLASNEQNFRVLAVPEQSVDLGKTLSHLQKLVPLTQRDIRRIVKQARKTASFVPLEIKDNLTWEEVAKIEVNLPDLPGISIDVGEIRHYPHSNSTAHLVGYVGAVSRSELTGDPVLTLPGFRIGKTGLEKTYDKELRGMTGTAEMEVNVVGREVRELKRHPARSGQQLKLSIDSELQTFVQERISREKSASAVIMDVYTGGVYSLVSAPSFDPNLFIRGLSAEKWEEMLANPGLPLNNKAIGGQYPPGSTFKMVTALAALEEGVITRNTSAHCPGHYDFGGDRFHCWKKAGHGRVDLVDALTESCDTFFYKMATDVGIDTLTKYAHKLGLGQKFDFELKEERPGLLPTRDWKMGHFGEPWQPGETVVASIGQGYIQTTPLQLAVMTSRLVNGGYAVKPWITAFTGKEPVPNVSWPKIDFKKRHLDLIVKGMNRVISHPKGTAYESRMENPQFQMGGKTGTAQVRRITAEERLEGVLNKDLPWRLRHHALFVGYAPIKKPRYACAVVVEHGGGGSSTAAPIGHDLLQMAQMRDPAASPLLPDGETTNLASPPPRKPKLKTKRGH